MLRAFLMPALRTTCLVGSLWMMQRASFWSRPTLVAGLWGAKAAIEDADEMNVDQAYRLTLLELNVSDTDDTENT